MALAGRRRVLRYIGAVVALAGIATAGLLAIRRVIVRPTPTPPMVKPPEVRIIASRVPRLPIDPEAPEWGQVREYTVELGPQAMAYPVNLSPAVRSLKVRVAYDNELIGFRLEWNDPKPHVDVLDVNRFADQCSVLLLSSKVPGDQLPVAWQMGTPEWPATILSWRADWQEDIDKGFREIEDLYPNIAVDGYAPYGAVDTIKDFAKPRRVPEMPAEARKWIAGVSAGNMMSEFERRSPVAKLLARGPATITPFKNQDALGKGVWRDGVWRVVLAKKMKASEENLGELTTAPGDLLYVAFAVWEGGAGERGGRKAISQLILAGLET